LNFYNLQFWREENKFQVIQGLFTRQEFAALDKKIQIISWTQNLLERAIGFFNIQFRQAISGSQAQEKSKFMIPGCDENRISYVVKAWIGEKRINLENKHAVTIHYFYHGAMYSIIFNGLGMMLGLYFRQTSILIIFFILCLISIVYRWISFKKKCFVYTDEILYTGGGSFGFSHSILPLSKIQNISITQNPYQWRRKLATLLIYTAGGPVAIPYIPLQKAKEILDYLIYQVEISKKTWM
jgi:putative membrane protein